MRRRRILCEEGGRLLQGEDERVVGRTTAARARSDHPEEIWVYRDVGSGQAREAKGKHARGVKPRRAQGGRADIGMVVVCVSRMFSEA